MKRYALLTYKRLWEITLGQAVLLFAISFAISLLPSSILTMPRWPWVLIAIASFSLAAFVSLMARSGYAQLTDNGLEVKSLFGEISVHYDDIEEASYGVFGKYFEPIHQNWSQRIFLQPFWFEPVLVLKVREFPYDYASLRLLFGKYLFVPEKRALVLLVSDVHELGARISSVLQEKRLPKARREDEPTCPRR